MSISTEMSTVPQQNYDYLKTLQAGDRITWVYKSDSSDPESEYEYTGTFVRTQETFFGVSFITGNSGFVVKDVVVPEGKENKGEDNKMGEFFFYHNRVTHGPVKVDAGQSYEYHPEPVVSGVNPLLEKQESLSSICSTESQWSSKSGEKSIRDVEMPSVVTKTSKFSESPLYSQLEKDLERVARYQQLWEFFNQLADEPGITFEQYTALVNLPVVDLTPIINIISSTRNDLAEGNLTTYQFVRKQYEDIIMERAEKEKAARRSRSTQLKSIPNVPNGAIVLSYYQKQASRFSKGDEIEEVYYLKPNGVFSSSKNPSSSYSFVGINKDELVFKLIQGSATASSLSSMGSSMKRGVSGLFTRRTPVAATGGKQTRRIKKKSSTRKYSGGKKARKSSKK